MNKDKSLRIKMTEEEKSTLDALVSAYGLRSYSELVRSAILYLDTKHPDMVIESGNISKTIKPLDNNNE